MSGSGLFACPGCGKDEGLWRGVEVPGWQSVGPDLQPNGKGLPDHEADWTYPVPDGTYGCAECGWEGVRGQLVEQPRIGVDGQPLPEPIPGQQELPTG